MILCINIKAVHHCDADSLLDPIPPSPPATRRPRANILISRMPSGICGVQGQVGTTRTAIQVFYLLTSSNDLGCDLLLTLVCWSQRAQDA